MSHLIIPPKRLREIAIQLIDGNSCYIGIQNAKIEYLINAPSTEKEQKANAKLLEAVTRKPDDYLKIPELSNEDLLESMLNFSDGLKDSKKAKELKNALNRKKPARNFIQAIESDMEYAIYWERFAIQWRADWVGDVIVEAHNY